MLHGYIGAAGSDRRTRESVSTEVHVQFRELDPSGGADVSRLQDCVGSVHAKANSPTRRPMRCWGGSSVIMSAQSASPRPISGRADDGETNSISILGCVRDSVAMAGRATPATTVGTDTAMRPARRWSLPATARRSSAICPAMFSTRANVSRPASVILSPPGLRWNSFTSSCRSN